MVTKTQTRGRAEIQRAIEGLQTAREIIKTGKGNRATALEALHFAIERLTAQAEKESGPGKRPPFWKWWTLETIAEWASGAKWDEKRMYDALADEVTKYQTAVRVPPRKEFNAYVRTLVGERLRAK
jgi:hypothetical protein